MGYYECSTYYIILNNNVTFKYLYLNNNLVSTYYDVNNYFGYNIDVVSCTRNPTNSQCMDYGL